MKKNNFLLILPIIIFLLECLPYGAVLNFANPEGEPWRQTYSYFSLTPFGYANFAPFITAIITCILLVMLIVYCITQKEPLLKVTKLLLLVGIVFSLAPLMFGIDCFSVVGILITISLIMEFFIIMKKEKHI